MKSMSELMFVVLLLLLCCSNVYAVDKQKGENDEYRSWLFSYLLSHPEEKKYFSKIAHFTMSNGELTIADVNHYKFDNSGLREYAIGSIVGHRTEVFYSMITDGQQSWMCDVLLNKNPDNDIYPVLGFEPDDKNLVKILEVCITKENSERWRNFAATKESKYTVFVKPLFDAIRKVTQRR